MKSIKISSKDWQGDLSNKGAGRLTQPTGLGLTSHRGGREIRQIICSLCLLELFPPFTLKMGVIRTGSANCAVWNGSLTHTASPELGEGESA